MYARVTNVWNEADAQIGTRSKGTIDSISISPNNDAPLLSMQDLSSGRDATSLIGRNAPEN